jgi:hypothetical protein
MYHPPVEIRPNGSSRNVEEARDRETNSVEPEFPTESLDTGGSLGEKLDKILEILRRMSQTQEKLVENRIKSTPAMS